MSDNTDNDDVLFALLSAVSAKTVITLVADADATKHKRRPRKKTPSVGNEILALSRVLRRVQQLNETCCQPVVT